MNLNDIYFGFLIGCMIFMSVLIMIALIRSFKGPTMADRVIAVNMLGTLTIIIIAILTIYLGEDYLADVCLVYAMVSFLSVVLLAKVYTGSYLQEKGIKGETEAIEANLEQQEAVHEKEEA